MSLGHVHSAKSFSLLKIKAEDGNCMCGETSSIIILYSEEIKKEY